MGWELETATCDDGSAVDAIEIESDETVICSFHNVRAAATGSIVIEKETRPGGDATSFAFTGDLGAFGLADGESKTVASLAVGTYVVAETAIDGWDTLSSCDDGSLVTAIDVAADEVVTCTFTNTKRPTLRIVKETDPASDPQDFAFTTVGSGLGVFSLDTDGTDGTLPASRPFVLLAGAYTVMEALPVTGWDFSQVSCASADGTSAVPLPSTTSSSVTVTLAVGDTVTCTYRNAKRARFKVVKTGAARHRPAPSRSTSRSAGMPRRRTLVRRSARVERTRRTAVVSRSHRSPIQRTPGRGPWDIPVL